MIEEATALNTKVEDFISIRQGSMSVEEYSLKFILLSKNDLSLMSNHRDEMSRFLSDVFNVVEEDCHTAMLHDDMNIYRLMVYAQSIEGSKHKRIIEV